MQGEAYFSEGEPEDQVNHAENEKKEEKEEKEEVEEEEEEGYFLKLTKNKKENSFLGKKTHPNNIFYENEINSLENNKKSSSNNFNQISSNKDERKNKYKSNDNIKWNKNGNHNHNNDNAFSKQLPSSRKKQICQFYINGACNKGNDCTFSHNAEQIKKEVIF